MPWGLTITPTISLFKADGTSVVKTVNMITEGVSNGTYATEYGWNKIPLRPTDVSHNNADRCTNPRTDQNNNDHHIEIVSQDGTKIWDMYHAYTCDNGATWYASLVRMYHSSEDGVTSQYTSDGFMSCNLQPDGTYKSDGYGAASSGKWPRINDLLTYDEVANDSIDHALGFNWQWYNPGAGNWRPKGTYPACNEGGYGGGSLGGLDYPLAGDRFQLNMTYAEIDAYVAQKDWSVAHKRVLYALKDYGMIMSEQWGDSFVGIRAAINNTHTASAWAALFGGTLSFDKSILSRFRVIEPLKPPFNNSDTIPPAAPQGVRVE